MEEAFIYSKHLQIHKSLVATSNPNKMGLTICNVLAGNYLLKK